jgi:phosphoglycolate phosphatase
MPKIFDCSAVIFDLDGTLVDTAHDIVAAVDALLAEYDRAPIGFAAGHRLIGDGARVLVQRAFLASGAPAPDVDAATARWFEIYAASLASFSKPYPHVAPTLAALRARGRKLAVCTNKADAMAVRLLEMLDLAGYFDVIVGGDVPHRKPDPRHLLATAERIGVPPRDCLIVGDSPNDAAAAKAARMPLVVVDWGYSLIVPAALGGDAVISDFAELEGLVA